MYLFFKVYWLGVEDYYNCLDIDYFYLFLINFDVLIDRKEIIEVFISESVMLCYILKWLIL